MTTIIPVETECSLCGTRSKQRLIGSIQTLGLPDLDTRPAELARSALPFGVQRCPACGYCARDISLEYPEAERVVRSPAYEKILRKRTVSEKARQFLAWASIQEANGEYGGAGWSSLHAAWACDDAEKAKGAAECRKLALERLNRQLAQLGHITGLDEPSLVRLVLADLCRRIGQFDQATRWARDGQERIWARRPDAGHPSDVVRFALEMELALIEDQDTACHSLEEIPGLRAES
jgi:hypothetical protein